MKKIMNWFPKYKNQKKSSFPELFSKNMNMTGVLISFLILSSFSFCGKKDKLTILTGDPAGNYYQGGVELKKIAEKVGINIEIKESEGSYQNVMAVGKGQSDLGISQMDVLVYLTYMDDEHKKASDNCLAIAPTEHEYIHLLVNKKSGINTMADFKDKKIAIGSAKSGTAFTFGFMSSYLYGFDVKSPNFVNMEEEEAIKKVVAGELDGTIYVTTLNSALFTKIPADAADKVRLLTLTKDEVDSKAKKVYNTGIIKAGAYPWLTEDVELLVTRSFLIASAKSDPVVIEKLVKTFYESEVNLDEKSHLWTDDASKAYLQLTDLKVPFHPIVDEYFKNKK